MNFFQYLYFIFYQRMNLYLSNNDLYLVNNSVLVKQQVAVKRKLCMYLSIYVINETLKTLQI